MLYLLAAAFLPLFPFSMIFNFLLGRSHSSLLQGLLVLVWPQVGLSILYSFAVQLPAGIEYWAVFTAFLYAFRAIALREVILWSGFLMTSSAALLWLAVINGAEESVVRLYAVGISLTFVIMVLLCRELRRRFESAFTGLYTGLAEAMPRFSIILVFAVLAIIGTPVFPSYHLMFDVILLTQPALGVVLVFIWLLWAWAGTRLVQGLLIGENKYPVPDLGWQSVWPHVLLLTGTLVLGAYLGTQLTGAVA